MSIKSKMQRLSSYLVSMSRDGKIAFMAISDAIALSFCFMLAMWLRLGDLNQMLTFGYLPYLYIPTITVILFFFVGLYRAVVRFIDRHLLTRTILALGGVVLLSYALSFFISMNKIMLPRNALLIYWLVAFAYVLASRLTVRSFLRRDASSTNQSKISVAIYGASTAGVRLLEAIRADQNYNVTCFLDDKSDLIDQTISGLRVFDTNHLSDLVNQLGISQIIIAVR
jgi:FlaA1/EpsC-like NDP-sugar epimerase